MFLRRIFGFLINDSSKSVKNINAPLKAPVVPSKDFYQKTQALFNDKTEHKKCNKPDKRDQIPSNIRNNVWVKYYGKEIKGLCYCCGKSVNRFNAGWHCSHVISYNKGGSLNIENLRICCQHCNLSMGNQNLYVYIKSKNLQGPGKNNVNIYLNNNKSQANDKRTNNWGK